MALNFMAVSTVLGTWVAIGGAAFGGMQALNTYQQEVAKMEDARVVQTFQLFEMFNSPSRLTARAHLFEHTKHQAELDPNDLYVILDFYDALQVCVERNLCDRDLANRLFHSYATPFWDSMGQEIVSGRTESDPNFGAGLQWLASLPPPAQLEAPSTSDATTTTETPTATTTPASATAP